MGFGSDCNHDGVALRSRSRGGERKDAPLSLSKSGPNNLDIMGVGTKTPGYSVVITYDRLVTFGTKPDAKGVDNED